MIDHEKHLRSMKWRGKLQPTFALPLTQPIAMQSSEVRRTVEHFLTHGKSGHSAMGSTLWALLDYLQRSGTPYVLTAYPGKGYEVAKAPELDLG